MKLPEYFLEKKLLEELQANFWSISLQKSEGFPKDLLPELLKIFLEELP